MACILIIETSTEICSLALSLDGSLVWHKEDKTGYSHSVSLGVFVDEAMSFAATNKLSIQAVAVSSGPGSYTGLRIGVSMAKGLCYGLGVPMIAVDTLQAMAASFYTKHAGCEDFLCCPMIDARRMEVYDAIFKHDLTIVKPVSADIVDQTSFGDFLANNKVVFIGNGATKCKPVLDSPNAVFMDDEYLLAADMAGLANQLFEDSRFVDVAYFEPFYLKDFVATTPKNKVLNK